ncbi:MAG: NAD-dependent epimerase/dehydratase family protein [Planctomycetota bacterium]
MTRDTRGATSDAPLYIVTGGAGFIGANLCAELVRREPSAELVVIDDFRTGSFLNLTEAFSRAGLGAFGGIVQPDSVGDIDWGDALDALRPRAVFHLGAITDTLVHDQREMLRVNTETFAPILHNCLEARVPLVYASSGATYGTPPHADRREPFPEDAAGRPSNVYGFSKWLMDAEASRALRDDTGDARVVGLRYFNVFGPGEHRKGTMASMVWHLTNQVLDGKRPRLFKRGEHARDQVPVADIVGGTIHAALDAGVRSGVYNLGSGVTTTFNDIARCIGEALGVDAEPEYFDMPEHMVDTYQSYTCADMTRTRERMGWSPSVSPAEAIRSYAAWIRDQRAAGSAVGVGSVV